MKRALWLGLGVVLLSNAVALGGVWYNRSGAPEAQLLLSERELQRVYGSWLREQDDGVLRLQLSWRHAGEGWRLPWLDEAKLRELGFAAGTDEQAWSRQPAREVWLVLELDGPVHRRQVEQARQALEAAEAELRARPESEVLQQERDEHRRRLLHEQQQASRLILVDAGVDAEVLRQRWPDRQRQVVLVGRMEPYRHGAEAGYGASIRLENDRLSVPHAYRELARGWERSYEQSGFKAQVEVAFGRRHEPWVLSIRQ
ncbi:DUF4824 family protein [Ectopseudomonas guguanensis]|uniref:DUF4824 family protein n=1 Tax=Ectopseudomonas guguanensis TaxID=1198456 RepID=UPI0012D67A8B|nr:MULTISPECIES: DUF4824 family protein [Pseudomonas]MPT16520.1 DUF4824 family protein [Pseudomonas sp.]WJH55000.1 DUF4824 family protein [Pseudomonas guguanensis]